MKKKNKQINIQYIKFINKIVICDKKLFLFAVVRILLGSLAALLIPYLNKIIIDNYINNFSGIIENIIILITIEFVIHLIIKLLNYEENRHILNKENALMVQVIDKYININNTDLNEEVIDKFNKSKNFLSNYGITNAYNNYVNVLQNIITIIGLIFLFDVFSLIIVFIILIFTFVNVIIKNKFNIKIYTEKYKLSPIIRKLFYMFGIMWDNKYAKEIKMYKMKAWLKDETAEIINNSEKINKSIFTQNCKVELASNIIYILQLFLIYLLLVFFTIRNMISVSNFTLYVSTITSFILCLKSILWAISELLNNSLYFSDYSLFMKKSEGSVQKHIIEQITKIEFKNVSFMYDNSKEKIIDNLSFSLVKGESLTIVGKNGVGKSTIIKLLLSFLKPNSGIILVNDYNLNDIDLNSYYNNLSCLFQNDILLPYSLKDNISPFNFDDDKANEVAEKTLFASTMKKCNVGYNDNFSNKLDSNGVNFSGGEIQELLLTRTLYKNSDLLILDEPSSNLSQLVENNFYKTLLKNKKYKVTIMVSHRLGFCEYSDKILVLDKNGNIEYGNQQELLHKKGLYYLMYQNYYNN